MSPRAVTPGGGGWGPALLLAAVCLGAAFAAKGCSESVERGVNGSQHQVSVPAPSAGPRPTPPVAP